MSDFDLRDMFDEEDDDGLEEFSDISFDDILDDEYDYGQEIGSTDQFAPIEPPEPGPFNKLMGALTPQQRLLVAIMLFGNVLILSIGALMATGRIG